MGACVQKAAKAYWDFLCGEFHKVLAIAEKTLKEK
jgi:hypothetical protein